MPVSKTRMCDSLMRMVATSGRLTLRTLIALAVLLLCAPALAQTPPTLADLEYSDIHFRCKLDLYLPIGAATPYPLVIYAHGGGWLVGDEIAISIELELVKQAEAVTVTA